MKRTILILTTILGLLSGINVKGQVTVREAEADVVSIFDALSYIVDNAVTPDSNGTIHIDVTGNVTEPALVAGAPKIQNFSTNPGGTDPLQQVREAVFNISNTNIKKIAISSIGDTKHPVTIPYHSGSWYNVYLVKMAYTNAELEVSNLTFTVTNTAKSDCFAWIVSTSSTGAHSTRTYFHDCVFTRGCSYQTNPIPAADISDTFEFDYNEWKDLDNYIFHIEAGTNEDVTTSLVFKYNHIESYRGVATKFVCYDEAVSLKRKWNITFDHNTFYHLMDFDKAGRTVQSSVCLFQNTGPFNGNYTFTNNIILGHFTAKGTPAETKSKVCAMILQHGGGKYQGVVDGSSFILDNNTLQCDVYPIGWKPDKTVLFDTDDVTQLVADGEYYDISSQTGDYSKQITPPIIVHMYPKSGTPHDDSDNCHVCEACGQIVVHAEVAGHGGKFEYLDASSNAHDVNSAEHSIAHNLYPDDIALGRELIDYVVDDVKRDGLCLNPLQTQTFVVTPLLPNTFQKLTVYGRSPEKVLEYGDEGLIFQNGKLYYTFKNDFEQTNRYSSCPKLVAEFGYGSIKITCEGLDAGESALFDVKDGSGNVLFTVNLSSEKPEKIVSGLTAGTYTVQPHQPGSWHWTYTMTPDTAQSVTVTNGTEKSVEYSVSKKDSITTKNDESYKDNELSAGDPDARHTGVSNWKKGSNYDL